MASEAMAGVLERLRERPRRTDEPIDVWRDGMEDRAKAFRPQEGVSFDPVNAAGVDAEWTIPSITDNRFLIYFHGGGYCCGSISTHRVFASFLAVASKARVLNVGYRLAPEHPYPAAVHDAVAVYEWLLAQNIAPGSIAMGGDSAGGGLTIAALMSLRDARRALPAAAVLLCPWTDLTLSGASIESGSEAELVARLPDLIQLKEWYLNGHTPEDPMISQIFVDLTGLPPMLVQAGKADILLDDGRRFAQRAVEAGVNATLEEWDEMIHVWQALAPILPEGQQAVNRIGKYLQDKIR